MEWVLGSSRCRLEDRVACNFSHSRRGLDSVGETNSLERRMTIMVRRENKISMFKMVEEDVIKVNKMNKTI